ncbi:hypothetical protein E4U43_002793, partial [Claviceps pusilla]
TFHGRLDARVSIHCTSFMQTCQCYRPSYDLVVKADSGGTFTMVVVSVGSLELWYTNSIVEPSSAKWPDGEQRSNMLSSSLNGMRVRDCIRSIMGMPCNEDDDNPDNDDTGSGDADRKTLASKHPKSSPAKPSQAKEKGRKRTRVSSPAFVGIQSRVMGLFRSLDHCKGAAQQ